MVEQRTADDRLLGWEEGRDASPLLVGQLQGGSLQHLDLRVAEGHGSLPCPPSSVTGFGHRLMVTPERRPRQTAGKALGWLDQRKQEATDLGHR